MEGLPPELCQMIGTYVKNTLFKIDHQNILGSYYVLAPNEAKAIMLLAENIIRTYTNNVINQYIKAFVYEKTKDDVEEQKKNIADVS